MAFTGAAVNQGKPYRPGVKETPFPATPVLLGQKTFKRHNILIGYDPVQEQFASQFFNTSVQLKDSITDEDILGHQDALLYRVEHSWNLEISPQVRNAVGIFSISPMVKGSSGVYAIVKHAAILLGLQKSQTEIAAVADELVKEPIHDVMAAVWHAVWLLTGPAPDPFKPWPEPWASKEWLPVNVDPVYRLNTLYRDCVALVYARGDDEEAAHKFGVRPTKFKVLKDIGRSLDLRRLRASILELNRWRQLKYNPLVCALKITNIWQGAVS
jgi:hypothetical protein